VASTTPLMESGGRCRADRGGLEYCTSFDPLVTNWLVQFLLIMKNKYLLDPTSPALEKMPTFSPQYLSALDPTTEDARKTVLFKSIREQLKHGIHDPVKMKGGRAILDYIPKRRVPPGIRLAMGEQGYGLRPKFILYPLEAILWVLGIAGFTFLFLGLWLGFVNKTDLQNGFQPVMVLTAFFTLAMAFVQFHHP
jgi:hypothetical protein